MALIYMLCNCNKTTIEKAPTIFNSTSIVHVLLVKNVLKITFAVLQIASRNIYES